VQRAEEEAEARSGAWRGPGAHFDRGQLEELLESSRRFMQGERKGFAPRDGTWSPELWLRFRPDGDGGDAYDGYAPRAEECVPAPLEPPAPPALAPRKDVGDAKDAKVVGERALVTDAELARI